MITLDIFADPVCPWCFIGKARLDRALAQRPNHPFQRAWQPFELNPTMPPDGMARADYLQAKFGQDGAAKMHVQLLEIAEAEGYDFHPERVTHQPNTRNAHRLLHWAGLEERQEDAMEGLLAAHWRDGRNIGDATVLCEVAEAAKMDPRLVERLLASDADIDTIVAKEAHARERGINAVPSVVVANAHLVSGAQPTDLWLQVIDELSGAPSDATQH
ncbi:polyketide biosynthesis protein [Thioclava sediminum]|uniref:Polyketide biosynthesis protein n=1 Tax=Thioclava sediminum TaxID=1915319 RepID=A0ABX3MV19_9RHOB|nr:DsbA family oxidoreductase [Thioclava sediminum]OOY23466.1 polyketide biosynthesis protein [Thioclava sediminum]